MPCERIPVQLPEPQLIATVAASSVTSMSVVPWLKLTSYQQHPISPTLFSTRLLTDMITPFPGVPRVEG